ncbi:MAG: HD domain-containing phosphohydrolase, partial [Anaerolineae bacterium]
TLVLGASLSRRVAEPLTRLTDSAARVAAGHLSEQVEIQSSDEIGILAEGFNTMTGALRDFTDELRRKIAELAHLHDATHELTGELDLNRVVSASTEQIYLAGQLDLAALFLREEGGGYVCQGIRAAREDLAASLAGLAYRPQSDLERASLEDLEPTILNGQSQWLGLHSQVGLEEYPGQVALIPMMAGEAQGFLLAAIQEGRGKFDTDRVRLISTMAGGAARAVHNARLYQEGVERVHELMAVGEMSRTIISYLSLDQVLEQAIREIRAALQPGALLVALMDDDSGVLQIQAGYGLGRSLSLPRRMRDRLATRAVEEGEPVLHRERAAEDNGRAESRLYMPLSVNGEPVGVIAVVQGPNGRRLGEADVRVLSTIANELAVAIRNARLYEDLRALYDSAVRSLALAIDARDPYTHGHSVRVIENSLTVGRHMGLPHSALQNLEIAAHLHDIGKIGVPDGILKKPGALSREEKRKVDQHPKVGAQILGPLDFNPEVVQAVMHHHERFDGRGYPTGLKSEEIPIGARILSVVDAFDAMVSDRPYRSALSLDAAIQELEDNSGSQFDPVVVEAVLELVDQDGLRTPGAEARPLDEPPASRDTHTAERAIAAQNPR